MTINDKRVLAALATDMTAALKLRAMSFQCAQSEFSGVSEIFWCEYLAVEQFVQDHFCNDCQRFFPII